MLGALIASVLSSPPSCKIATKPLGLRGSSLVEAWTNQGRSKSLCKRSLSFFSSLPDDAIGVLLVKHRMVRNFRIRIQIGNQG